MVDVNNPYAVEELPKVYSYIFIQPLALFHRRIRCFVLLLDLGLVADGRRQNFGGIALMLGLWPVVRRIWLSVSWPRCHEFVGRVKLFSSLKTRCTADRTSVLMYLWMLSSVLHRFPSSIIYRIELLRSLQPRRTPDRATMLINTVGLEAEVV